MFCWNVDNHLTSYTVSQKVLICNCVNFSELKEIPRFSQIFLYYLILMCLQSMELYCAQPIHPLRLGAYKLTVLECVLFARIGFKLQGEVCSSLAVKSRISPPGVCVGGLSTVKGLSAVNIATWILCNGASRSRFTSEIKWIENISFLFCELYYCQYSDYAPFSGIVDSPYERETSYLVQPTLRKKTPL
jgi:hypothetical protein